MSDASMARCEKCKRVAYDCHVIAMNASRAAASSQEVRSGPAVSSASIAIARRKTKPVRHIPMSVFGELARGCRRVPLEATDRYWQLCCAAIRANRRAHAGAAGHRGGEGMRWAVSLSFNCN
jgi:hypothetical protein